MTDFLVIGRMRVVRKFVGMLVLWFYYFWENTC